jgi:hypothetical protein
MPVLSRPGRRGPQLRRLIERYTDFWKVPAARRYWNRGYSNKSWVLKVKQEGLFKYATGLLGLNLKHMKLDKTTWSAGSLQDMEKEEAEQLSKLSHQKKSAAITYLRECYYGRKATTGRLQRIFEMSKLP